MSVINDNVMAIATLCFVIIFNGLPKSNACGALLFGELTKIKDFTLKEIKSAELHYFNSEGVAQSVRFLLAINKITFKDKRFEHSEWPQIKPKMPYRHVPLLIINNNLGLTQSDAICRFLAENTSYKTNTPWEEYLVGNYVDTMHDLRRDITKFLKQKDQKKLEMQKTFARNVLPIYMNKFENIVRKNGGYFVNKRFTMADIFFASMINAVSKLSNVDALENRELLLKLRNTVFEIPEVKEWLLRH